MKLMRLGEVGHEKPVVRVDEHGYVDVSEVTPDFDEAFFAGDGMLRLTSLAAERVAAGAVHPFTGNGVGAAAALSRIGAPIARPHEILCIGLNYSAHAAGSGMPVLSRVALFDDAASCLVTMPGYEKAPPEDSGGAFVRMVTWWPSVVTRVHSLFSVIADCAAARSTIVSSAA